MTSAFRRVSYSLVLTLGVTSVFGQTDEEQPAKPEPPPGRWSVEKANAWYAGQPWLVGCNFIPSTAINQLEMWQADTFDPETIEKELDLAGSLGFNALRVYLHDLAHAQDPEGFLDRIDRFLAACSKRKIRPMLVFFDDVWLQHPKIGKQPEPFPGVHNSGWLESPGLPLLKEYPKDPELRGRLKRYVQAVLKRYGDDDRVLMWDLYNEPSGNWALRDEEKKVLKTGPVGEACLPLLRDVYAWAREIDPGQPLTSCIYHGKVTEIALTWTDIVTFHNYQNAERPRGDDPEPLKQDRRPAPHLYRVHGPDRGQPFRDLSSRLRQIRHRRLQLGVSSPARPTRSSPGPRPGSRAGCPNRRSGSATSSAPTARRSARRRSSSFAVSSRRSARRTDPGTGSSAGITIRGLEVVDPSK